MSSAISIGPICPAAAFTLSHSRKTAVCMRKGLDAFGPKNKFSWGRCIMNIDRNRTAGRNSVRVGRSEEVFQAFEPEALVEESLNLEATLNNISKWLLTVLWGGIVIWRHDGEVIWFLSGASINSRLSIALKKILNQERPVSTVRSDPGMPSSHAQSIFFGTTFLILSGMELYGGVNGLTLTQSGLYLVVGSYFTWLRVSQQMHTVPQVAVGALLGSGICILWSWLWHAFILPLCISTMWVRFAVFLAAVGLTAASLHHVYYNWILDPDDSNM